ncbi:hypothetical protein ACFWDQ_03115 [Streptomyces sp. NPDC060053]|uniref:hypothetical protein n=1 Tax=Streptomyces sp. NPDC060053 TaxID=3347047 RepID=UPI00368B40E9
MGQHTTDEVYDKVTDVESTLDGHSKSTVTITHFDKTIQDLKTAIDKGGKGEEEEPQSWRDIVKEMSPVKEFLAILKGQDLITKIALTGAAVAAAVGLVAGLLAKAKEISLAFTGRQRMFGSFGALRPEADREPRSFGRGEDGRWGLQAEQQPDARQPNLPSVEQINDVKEAMSHLNSQVGIYRDKVRGLATPRAMKQMASAAKKLESAAKNHQAIDTLASSINGLNREMRELAGTAS